MLLVLFLLTTALAACTDDEPKDSVKEIRMSYNKFLNKINEDLNIYAQNSA